MPYCERVYATETAVPSQITIEPGKRRGQPCIRGLRITVWDVLGCLGASMSEDQILDEHPDLERPTFQIPTVSPPAPDAAPTSAERSTRYVGHRFRHHGRTNRASARSWDVVNCSLHGFSDRELWRPANWPIHRLGGVAGVYAHAPFGLVDPELVEAGEIHRTALVEGFVNKEEEGVGYRLYCYNGGLHA